MSDTMSNHIETASTTAKNLPTLFYRDSGEAVRLLQQLLLAAGYYVSFNAQFDDLTLNAVKNFQAVEGLVVDGIVGQYTWRTLGARALSCSQCK
ncbi:MAG: peptidoglycan-binding protein [Nostocaceae cyanobacterium]|nr:peptidoglycan-binding protein [Nostocaceae cyanobacterium]